MARIMEWFHGELDRQRSGSFEEKHKADEVELYIAYLVEDDDRKTLADPAPTLRRRSSLERYVVARTITTPTVDNERHSMSSAHHLFHHNNHHHHARATQRTAEYAAEMLERAEAVDEAVERAVCDSQHSTAASRKTDVLAAMAPMKLRRLAEKAAAVSRQHPQALVNILKKDPNETALQEAFDALTSAAASACQWLSFAPWKRGYAVSLARSSVERPSSHTDGDAFEERGSHHQLTTTNLPTVETSSSTGSSVAGNNHHVQQHHRRLLPLGRGAPNSLAVKYANKLDDAFLRIQAALTKLDTLRGRLPTTARLVRFAARAIDPERHKDDTASESSETVTPPGDFAFDPETIAASKYTPDNVDDFLTDAAPLGIGIFSSEIFACRDRDGSLFLTSNWRTAEAVHDPHDESDHKEARPRPAVLATTTIYKVIDDPRKMALDDGDEIWGCTIDDREYFFCVMADQSDRGLRHALHLANVSDDFLRDEGITFRRVE